MYKILRRKDRTDHSTLYTFESVAFSLLFKRGNSVHYDERILTTINVFEYIFQTN